MTAAAAAPRQTFSYRRRSFLWLWRHEEIEKEAPPTCSSRSGPFSFVFIQACYNNNRPEGRVRDGGKLTYHSKATRLEPWGRYKVAQRPEVMREDRVLLF